LVWAVYTRARRDARWLGLSLKVDPLPAGKEEDQKAALHATLDESKVWKVARVCIDGATAGKGKPEEVAGVLRELRAMIHAVEPGEPLQGELRELTPATAVVVVAAGARLALAEGRTVEAVELATLASVDERSIRAAAATGTLLPVGNGRPMRFEAELVRRYLYERGVPGFVLCLHTSVSRPVSEVTASRRRTRPVRPGEHHDPSQARDHFHAPRGRGFRHRGRLLGISPNATQTHFRQLGLRTHMIPTT
jgi:hypothetical protein